MSSNKASLVTKLVNASVPAFVWLLAGIYFLAFSFSIRVPLTLDKFDPGPAFLPQLLGGGLLLGGLAQILHNLLASSAHPTDTAKRGSAIITTAVFGFILLLPVLGFHLSATIFSIVSMVLMKVGWLRTILSTTIIMFVIHFVFIEIFMIALPLFPF